MNIFVILAGLLMVSANAENIDLTALIGRKIETGWEYCDKNSSLRMRCSDDCESLEYCQRGRVMTIKCSTQTEKRYCDMETFSCTDRIDVCYNSRDFCPSDGIYPDLSNCARYVFCDGQTMHPFECDYGTWWNYKTGLCEENVTCQTYTSGTGCSGENWNAIVSHTNPKWFVFCYFGRPLLAECPGTNYTFDRKTGNCRFQCEHRELASNMKIQDERDETIFYDCYKIGGVWKTDEKKCPRGTYFNQGLQICKRGFSQSTTDGWAVPKPEPEPEPEPVPVSGLIPA